jgi:hypothetical protein
MKPKTDKSPESVVREIKRKTRRKFTFTRVHIQGTLTSQVHAHAGSTQ